MSQQLIRFDFGDKPLRGAAVRLGPQWQAWARQLGHPLPLTRLLGQAAAASVMMASHLKFEGKMNLQIQGGEGLALLLSQVTHDLRQRATIRLADGAQPDQDWATLSHGGRLAVIIDADKRDQRYQAVVPAGEDSLAANLVDYFDQSEQLPTRLWLAANADVAAGIMIQQMPAESERGAPPLEVFETAAVLGQTCTDDELLSLAPQALVHRLFATEGAEVRDARDVTVACQCSRDRIANVILSLGEADIRDLVEERGEVEAHCDFCRQRYVYSAHDALALFAANSAEPPSDAVH